MRIPHDEAMEIRGYLRGRRITFEQAAALVDCHRTTISNKLRGAQDVTAVELIEIGEQIGLKRAERRDL